MFLASCKPLIEDMRAYYISQTAHRLYGQFIISKNKIGNLQKPVIRDILILIIIILIVEVSVVIEPGIDIERDTYKRRVIICLE